MFMVQCPPDAAPGSTIQCTAPSGVVVQVQIPAWTSPGATFAVQDPGATTAGAADDYELEAYEPLGDKRWDVTNYIESICSLVVCPCAGWTKTTIFLSDQEVTLKKKNLLQNKIQKRPYAQLGSVDKAQVCGGICSSLASDLTPLNEKGEGGLVPGFGCGNDDLVSEIVRELQHRKEKRGGIAQIKKLDYMLQKVKKLATQVPLVAHDLRVSFDPVVTPEVKIKSFPDKTHDVTNYIEMVCGCTTRELHLGPEEAQLTINKCFGCQTLSSKREYGQLGFVEKQKQCCCCFKVASDLSPIPGQSDMEPQCPCTNGAIVSTLVSELRERMAQRGIVGQMRKQEQMLKMIGGLDSSMDLLVKKHGIQFPPPQDYMTARFGSDMPPPFGAFSIVGASEAVEYKKYDITNTIDKICTCCCTCGIAGCTTQTMELLEDDMYVLTKNNIDDSNMKQPYGEMDSVDVEKFCCCCWRVNVASPGCGCDKARVEEIAAELQARKEKRGNIAQLKQLTRMQTVALGLDIKGEFVCQKEGVLYPPSQETISQVFPHKVPRVLSSPPGNPHIDAEKEFETKEYDVTNYIECCCNILCTLGLAGPRWRKLTLNAEEMYLEVTDFCGRYQSRTPYGNLGSVETEENCCCFYEVPEVADPQCGCNKAMVDEIAGELQERKVKRGNIAQIKQQENIINEVLKLDTRMDLLLHKRGIPYPPAQEVMAKVFKPAPTEPETIGRKKDTE